jgi:hypothetical protein
MKKIIFVDIPMRDLKDNSKQCYANTGNTVCKCTEKVWFPINAILADKLKTDDEVKVVLLITNTDNDNSLINVQKFKDELNKISETINAKISYEIIESTFEETKDVHEKRVRDMISKIENDSDIYADITFGQKPLPMLLMCVLTFAEKFCNADIKKVIYGKVEFVKHSDGEDYPENPAIYDVTSLYYLNNLVGAMEAPSCSEAQKALDAFFNI